MEPLPTICSARLRMHLEHRSQAPEDQVGPESENGNPCPPCNRKVYAPDILRGTCRRLSSATESRSAGTIAPCVAALSCQPRKTVGGCPRTTAPWKSRRTIARLVASWQDEPLEPCKALALIRRRRAAFLEGGSSTSSLGYASSHWKFVTRVITLRCR